LSAELDQTSSPSWPPRLRAALRPRAPLAGLAVVVAEAGAAPASAQLAGSLAVQNDYIYRAYTMSAGRPVAILNLSYDNTSGLYLNGSTIAKLKPDSGMAVAGLIGNIGYARRVTPRLSVDTGFVQSSYFEEYGWNRTPKYTEVYVGVISQNLSSHVYYSPHYYQHGAETVYGEVESSVGLPRKFRLSAHAGYLAYVERPYEPRRPRDQYDWRLSLSRPIRSFDLHAALSSGGPGKQFYDHGLHGRTALVVGAAWNF
jgi:uncharacterized protein (TIGR02001 family)